VGVGPRQQAGLCSPAHEGLQQPLACLQPACFWPIVFSCAALPAGAMTKSSEESLRALLASLQPQQPAPGVADTCVDGEPSSPILG
jgi:hypothetical protein